MTPFAKMLVFVNVVIALILTGWTTALYTERVDWAPRPGPEEGKQTPGRLDDLKKQMDAYRVDKRDLAERRYQLELASLAKEEARRLAYVKWYADLLSAAETGKDVAGEELKPPVRVLVRKPAGKDDDPALTDFDMEKADPVKIALEVDKEKKVTKEEELKSADAYRAQYKDLRTKLAEAEKKFAELLEEHKKLSEEIVGIAEMEDGKPVLHKDGTPRKSQLGLQDKRNFQLAYLKNCLDEQKYLAPLVNNTQAELVLLRKRNAALKLRLEELEKFAANR